jgi:beta-glucanase (GH16 family)
MSSIQTAVHFILEMTRIGRQWTSITGRCVSPSIVARFSGLIPLQTNNLEWYDPEAITTKNGALQITLSRKETHGLDYEGGLMSTWNKFCFSGGLLQTSVSLPGANNIVGLWPAVWSMGNLGKSLLLGKNQGELSDEPSFLGRAGYGASLEGMVSSNFPIFYPPADPF